MSGIYAPVLSISSHDSGALVTDFEQVIVSAIYLTALFANWIMICSMSAVHLPLVLSWLRNPSTLAANFVYVILPVICYLHCLLTAILIFMSVTHVPLAFFCRHNSIVLAADFKNTIFKFFSSLALCVNWAMICSMSAVLVTLGLSWCNYGAMTADIEQIAGLVHFFPCAVSSVEALIQH